MTKLDIDKIIIMPATPNMYSCGPTVIHHIALLKGKINRQLTIEHLAKQIGTDPRLGTLKGQMLAGAKLLGLSASWTNRESLDELLKRHKQGSIVMVSFTLRPGTQRDEHYLVLEEATQGKVILNDPLGCLRIVTKEEFERWWFDKESGKKERHWAMIVN